MTQRAMQAVRNQFDVGDRVVFEKRIYGPHSAAILRGAIVQINGRMAAIRVCTDKWKPTKKIKTVGIERLRKYMEIDVTQSAPSNEQQPPLKLVSAPPLLALPATFVESPAEEEQLELEAESKPVRSTQVDNLTAWLEMGRSLHKEISDRIKALHDAARGCREDAEELKLETQRAVQQLEEKALGKEAEAMDLQAQLAAIDAATRET